MKHSLTLTVENEFASLVLCTLACYGFIMIYSATKSLNGPSDLLAGVLSGPHESIDGVCYHQLLKLLLPGQHEVLR